MGDLLADANIPLQKEFEVCVRVSATYEGRSGPLRFGRAGEKQQRDVLLPAPASLHVTAVTDAGREVDAEQVSLRSHLGDFAPTKREQKGDPWYFPELSPGDYQLTVFVKGWPFQRERLSLRPGETGDKRVVMRTGLTVSGVVVNSRGAPLVGTNVWWAGGTATTTAFGQTNETGHFEFGGLDDTPGKLIVRSLPEQAESGRELADLVLEGIVPGGEPLRIVLQPLGTIRGRFPALVKGTSMPIRMISRSLWAGSKTTLGASGRFECPVPIAREPFFLLFQREGYAPLIVDHKAMEPAQDADLGDLRFDQGFALAAVVEDEQGRAVAAAEATIAEKWSGENTRTDADGRFAFKRLPKRAICLRVDAKGYPMHLFRVDGQAFNPGVRLVLRKGGELRGIVLTSSGEFAAGASVMVVPNVADPYDRDHDETQSSVKCDADGRFQIRLQLGAYEVRAHDEGFSVKGSARVDIQDGGTSTVEVRLK